MTVAKTTVAEAARVEPPANRKPPVIDPNDVRVDVEGLCLRSLVAHLPEAFEASDLADPDIWSRVQGTAKALRKFDALTLISHDEGYLWRAVVAHAGPSFAVLARPERFELQARRNAYFSDDLYSVKWNGRHFDVVRKSDRQVMSGGHPCEGTAIRALERLYPKPL